MSNDKAALKKAIFVLSLDLELCWGDVDKPKKLQENKGYYEEARDCIKKLLELFEKYNLSATWAAVGHLLLTECSGEGEMKHGDIPRSSYPWYQKDWFEECPCSSQQEAPLWYGQDIIRNIKACSVYQEIACHSFSHIPFGDQNTRRDTVQGELFNCIRAAEALDIKLKSFVFPRNLIGYIDELKKFGFEAFRGAEPSWYQSFPKKLQKICHMADQLLAITPPVVLPEVKEGLYDIPASMLYLPMNGFRGFIPVSFRIRKAQKGIRKAIRQKKIFHIWFHPFNIATNKEKLLYGLEEILKEVQSCREKGLLETRSMGEIADWINNAKGEKANEN